jgi:cell division protein FtsZ
VLVSIIGGPDLALKEVSDIMGAIRARLRADTHLMMGTVLDDAWRNKVMISALVSSEWTPAAAPREAESEPDAARDAPGRSARGTKPGKPGKSGKPGKTGRTGKTAGTAGKPTQTSLSFDDVGRSRFKDVEPTVLDGENVDIPTFVRRGIEIEK